MIALLGPRPFETEDPFDAGMLGNPAPSPTKGAPLDVAPGAIGDIPAHESGMPQALPVAIVEKNL